MFKLRQQQVYRPQTTPVRSGACSQSVTGWQTSERGATVPPGSTQETDRMAPLFIVIIRGKNTMLPRSQH